MNNAGLVTIIIVNYNGEKYLPACLDSIVNQNYSKYEIILVDNASQDNSVALVKSTYPFVKIIKSERNLGFSGGNNLGIRFAKGEYYVLLNNDTIVDKNWLTELLKKIKENNTSLSTSKVITENIPQEYYEMNGSINYIGYNIMRVFTDLSMIFFAGGASLIMKREENLRLFPDEYFLYHEDVYLSWKARLQGKNVVMAQNSLVYHKGSATTKRQTSAFSTFFQERNRLLNCLIFYEGKTLVKLLPYFFLDAFTKVILSVLSGRKSLFGIIRSYFWIFTHPRFIFTERNYIQSIRTVGDNELLKLMSCKIVDSSNRAAQVINLCSKIYSRIVALPHYD
ncbi:MAG: glycosyltransferase family 2 protein [Bacteroidetes bacterium]|nr:glycosyltransferase family 2 protein [Bacteroidota bacterium]